MSVPEPHVVWWGSWKGALGVAHYTKKHYTEDANVTLCGRHILVGGDITFFPKTSDDPNTVTCRTCRKAMVKKGIA